MYESQQDEQKSWFETRRMSFSVLGGVGLLIAVKLKFGDCRHDPKKVPLISETQGGNIAAFEARTVEQ